ncbi:hypothetical protein Ddye_014424 [Dipteronia dyeriana]|uniref:MADS-box domain-containing protein n=1 Tax=Dipteronia dyeriana TaxID=168575 RepID=A0AAE0CL55_9ROSI|nr:hypothetical protein Ddye_014424 [Dipteronia dyeriana]
MEAVPKTMKGRGRQKIEIKKLEDETKRMVTFTKRRKGLFKKASEISKFYGAKTAVIVFSQNGKTYSCGDVDSVFDWYLTGKVPTDSDMVSMERKKPVEKTEEETGFWWEKTADEMMLEWLMEYEATLQELKKNVEAKLEEVRRVKAEDIAKASSSLTSLSSSSSKGHVGDDQGAIVSFDDQVYHPETSSLLSTSASSSSINGQDYFQGAIVRVDDQVHHHHGEFVDDQYGNQYFDDFDFGEVGLNGGSGPASRNVNHGLNGVREQYNESLKRLEEEEKKSNDKSTDQCLEEKLEGIEKEAVNVGWPENLRAARLFSVSELWKGIRKEKKNWKQKFRVKWLKDGDRNSKFFHILANDRKQKNFISDISIDGVVCSKLQDLRRRIVDFFKCHFEKVS